jgi:hypothetical protein
VKKQDLPPEEAVWVDGGASSAEQGTASGSDPMFPSNLIIPIVILGSPEIRSIHLICL